MPSMFSRRRASSQPPRPSAPPSASAAIAASSAFLQSSTSTASLSSAAAAAALRSHTTSPEPIGNIQTKRMVRRGSQTSIASASVMGRPGAGRGMVRRDSNSSMTERTFRSPSPGRSAAVPPAIDAPPVPAVPKGTRRSASVDPPSQRVTSPTPRRGGRNASVDRTSFVGKSRAPAGAALAKLPELERENSQRSVNFSRPMSPGPGSSPAPTAGPTRPQSAAGYFTSPIQSRASPRVSVADRPRSSMGMSAAQTRQIEKELQDAANKPVMKKKKKALAADQGERLANGTMHTGPTGSAITPSAAAVSQPVPQATNGQATPAKMTKQKTATDSTDANAAAEPPPKNPARFTSPSSRNGDQSPASPRAAGLLHKQPSVVREDPEAEGLAEQDSFIANPQSPPRSASVSHTRRVVSTSEGPAVAYKAPREKRAASLDIPRANNRTVSLSPQRNRAHFSDVLANTPSSKHNPPPRSVSPFKSALKHSPASSSRGNSPAGVNGTRVAGSDASDTTSLASQDGIKPGKKRKSVRVSFDDGGTTVSPPAPAPALAATPNASKPLRRELSPVAANDAEVDETMTPRPALPSFGSVRKGRAQSPDVAEKVTETVPSTTSSSVVTLPERNEVTSDHALGALVANDFAQKQQSDSDKPLPPQVTSVEGSGYASDSSYSSQGTQKHTADLSTGESISDPKDVTDPAQPAVVNNHSTMTRSKDAIAAAVLSAPVTSATGEETTVGSSSLPNISVQPATPGTEEDKPILDSVGANVKKEQYVMPGGWEESEESKSESTVPPSAKAIEIEEPDFESSEEEDALEPPALVADRHSPNLEPIYESDSDNSDAFSDANEDFDGGFASLDAVLGSPVRGDFPGRAISTPPESPSTNVAAPKQPVFKPSTLSTNRPGSSDSNSDGDWTQATAYWSSLTREKKEQMERQAQPGDAVVPAIQQAPKPKKRAQAPNNIPMPVTTPVSQPLESPASPRSPSEQPDSRFPAIKKTMRSPAPASPVTSARAPASVSGETHMRKSMRSGAGSSGGGVGGGMKTSMRQEPSSRSSTAAEPRGALQKKRIPTTASAPSLGSSGAALAAARQAPAPASVKAPVAATDDSDSESSFRKKKRRGSVSTVDSAGRYNMKRSMRAGSVEPSTERRPVSPSPAPRGSGRLSIRSLSPNGSFMGRNRGENLRASLRGAPVDDTPTLRGKKSKALRDSKSPTRFSMSGFSKGDKRASSLGPAPPSGRTSRFKSRFNDSDDEDDGPSMGFRSRFADSDDEDSPIGPPRHMPADLAPVRGIPRSQNRYDDDSTDLEDSEDDTQAQTNNTKTKKVSRRSTKPAVPTAAEIDAAMAAAVRNVTAMNGGRPPGTLPEATNGGPKKQVNVDLKPQTNGVDADLTSPPATPSKRRGLLGSMLGRRRTSSVASVPQIPSTYYAPSSPSVSQGPQSPAGTGTPTGRLQRRTTNRTNSNLSAMPIAPQTREGMQAEQQKASTPGALSTNSQNWPLPPAGSAVVDDDRPNTSDGADAAHMRRTMRGSTLGAPSRPDFKRRSMSGGDIERMSKEKNAIYSEKTGKKKRFGLLRRAFGLND